MNPTRLILVFSLSAVQGAAASDDREFPAILVRPAERDFVPDVSPTPKLPTSPHIRAHIQALAARPAEASSVKAPASGGAKEPVQMAPFIVAEDRPLRLRPPPRRRTFLEAVRSGRLWDLTPDGAKQIVTLGEPGAGGHARLTFGISISF